MKSSPAIVVFMSLLLFTSVPGCIQVPVPGQEDFSGEPEVFFTFVPPIGSRLDLEGGVAGVDPHRYRVAVYIQVDGWWWVKPTYASPLTAISFLGTWSCDITTGGHDEDATEIRAYAVPADYDAPGNSLPEEGDYIAMTSYARE